MRGERREERGKQWGYLYKGICHTMINIQHKYCPGSRLDSLNIVNIWYTTLICIFSLFTPNILQYRVLFYLYNHNQLLNCLAVTVRDTRLQPLSLSQASKVYILLQQSVQSNILIPPLILYHFYLSLWYLLTPLGRLRQIINHFTIQLTNK